MGQCQLELRQAGKAYPRTCPTCGLSGACVKGLNAGVPDRNPMTPAQPALDAMMEGVWAVCAIAEKGNQIGYRMVQANARTKEEAVGAGLARFQKEYPGHSFSSVEAMPIAMPSALAAEVRAQRETIAGLEARVEALTGALKKHRRLLMPLAMELAQAEVAGQSLGPETVLFSFMGSGASDQVTLEMFLDAEDASRATLSGDTPNG
jgi:hypothetical protein